MVKELAKVAPSKRYQAWRTYFNKILNNMIDADPGIEDECEILEFNEGKKNHRVYVSLPLTLIGLINYGRDDKLSATIVSHFVDCTMWKVYLVCWLFERIGKWVGHWFQDDCWRERKNSWPMSWMYCTKQRSAKIPKNFKVDGRNL